MQKKKYKCPICEHDSCDELIIDLLICNECSHIFKKDPYAEEVCTVGKIHRHVNPIEMIRIFIEANKRVDVIRFEFPSLMFHTLDLKPNDFYKHKYNHYFNQMSLMIFLKRCELIPIKQENIKIANTSFTMLETEVEK